MADLISASGLVEGGRVLDYGCADRPYADLFPSWVEYVGADLPGNPEAALELGPGGCVPAPDESFDLVLSTQVLEHVEDPARYLAECARVLRPGGSLVLTTHGIMYYHRDPEDYWRWTIAGLRMVVGDAGFRITEERGVMGLAPAALQLLQDATYWKVPRVLRRPYVVVMQSLIALTDHFYSEGGRVANGLVIGVRARRP